MATLSQIEANRRNSLLSTGPKTPEGKAAVCFNALKTGIHAESLVIPGEDPEEFRLLTEDFTTCWKPQDVRERELVDDLAIDTWRLKRLRIAEAQIWIGAIDDKRKCNSHCDYTEIGDAYLWRVKVLGDMQRQVNSIKRNLRDTTRELQRLQAARRKEDALPVQQLTPQIKMEEQSQSEPEEQEYYTPKNVPNAANFPTQEMRAEADWRKMLKSHSKS